MREFLRQVADRFAGGHAEADPGFRAQIVNTSLMSLRAIGGLEFVIPLLMLGARLGVIPITITGLRTAIPNLLFAVLGTLTFGLAFTPLGRRWPRLITAASVWASMGIMIWSALLLTPDLEWVEHHILGYTVLVMFACASAVPLRPLHTLALGLSAVALELLSLWVARENFGWTGANFGIVQNLFTVITTLLCTALTSSVYRQRYTGYLAHQSALLTSERLRQTERRLLLSENSATMGRVAAALSHELNSPIGALSSAVETLWRAGEKMATTADEAERIRLRDVIQDLGRAGRESTERLRGIVGRIQRFTNLDRAEVQSADINSLIGDVVAMVDAANRGKVPIETDLRPVPKFLCRPQQLSAVVSNLLTNALDAVGEDGGRVRVASRTADGSIEIEVEDNGSGIPPEQLETLFDPAAFRASQGRMTAGNLGLFSSQQIVREHGGAIDVTSAGGKGTTVRVSLPFQEPGEMQKGE